MQSFNDQLTAHQKRLAQAIETLTSLETVTPLPSLSSEIMCLDKMRVLHFAPLEQKFNTPLLICYALVNRPYILDLEPKRSLIRDLVDAGHSVYLIDWGYPEASDQYLGLDDYISDYLHAGVNACLAHSASKKLDLMGVCQGGVFSLCYSFLHPEKVSRLITLVTPIDTEVENFTLAQMLRKVNIDNLVKAQGNISGGILNQLYANLKPLELGLFKQLYQAGSLSNPDNARTFLRMEHWLADSPDLAGCAAAEFATGLFKRNGLVNASLKIGGKTIDLSQLELPVLNIFGRKDHLVPPDSSRALEQLLLPGKSKYTQVELDAGHIGAFISHNARKELVLKVNSFRSIY